MPIDGRTELIAHIGYPTHSFKAPLIYNPWFAHAGVNAAVVPFGCRREHYPAVLHALFQLSNLRGALITMPHKVATCALVDVLSPAACIAGACNAVRRDGDGRLRGDLFDGEGFVRGLLRKGLVLARARALVVGNGGVGSAIAASLAAQGVGQLALFDVNAASTAQLAQRLAQHHPALEVRCGERDPAGLDLVVNASPLGMEPGDAMPVEVSRLSAGCWVGEVVMKQTITPFLAAAQARGCRIQVGSDMLFEQIPAYLEFFGLPSTTADDLRRLAPLD